MSPISLVMADDHAMFRSGVIALLKMYKDLVVVGEASDGKELLDLLAVIKQPDVLLLDLSMPNMGGFAVLEVLKKQSSTIKTIVISMHDEDHFITKAIEDGACGFLSKSAEPDEIQMAVHSVMENGFYFNDKTNLAMIHNMVSKKKLVPVFNNTSVTFSDKEKMVLQLLARELTSTEISNQLNLSERTIEGLRSAMIKKTGVRNVVGLILFAVRNKVIEP